MNQEQMKKAWETYKNGDKEIPPATQPKPSDVALALLYRPILLWTEKKLRKLQGKDL